MTPHQDILIWLFILHFIADFLLQSRAMGRKKSENIGYLLAHLAIQFVVVAIGLFIFVHDITTCLLLSACNAIIHGVIDWHIWRIYKCSAKRRLKEGQQLSDFKYYEDHLFYTTIGFDQLLHITTLTALAGWLL